MRHLGIAALVAVCAGCDNDNGRYQIAPADPTSVWRLDTRTGNIKKCFIAPGANALEGTLVCAPAEPTKSAPRPPGPKA